MRVIVADCCSLPVSACRSQKATNASIMLLQLQWDRVEQARLLAMRAQMGAPAPAKAKEGGRAKGRRRSVGVSTTSEASAMPMPHVPEHVRRAALLKLLQQMRRQFADAKVCDSSAGRDFTRRETAVRARDTIRPYTGPDSRCVCTGHLGQ